MIDYTAEWDFWSRAFSEDVYYDHSEKLLRTLGNYFLFSRKHDNLLGAISFVTPNFTTLP